MILSYFWPPIASTTKELLLPGDYPLGFMGLVINGHRPLLSVCRRPPVLQLCFRVSFSRVRLLLPRPAPLNNASNAYYPAVSSVARFKCMSVVARISIPRVNGCWPFQSRAHINAEKDEGGVLLQLIISWSTRIESVAVCPQNSVEHVLWA